MQQQFNVFDKTLVFKGLKAEIQTFTQQLHYLTHIESYKTEITGVKGKDEHSTTFFVMFGKEPMREPELFKEKVNTLLDRYTGKTLTVQDLPIFKAEVKEIFNAHVNVADKSRTEEEETQHTIKMNKIHADNEAKQKIEKEKKELEKNRIQKEYPFLQTFTEVPADTSSRILATKNIRRELEREYPAHKFSITSETFSGGDSIDVRWEDGVTEKEVNEIISKYQEGHFDGMTDCYNYSNSPFTDIFGGSKYVRASRKINKERYIEVAETLGYTVTFEGDKMFVVDANGETGGYDGIISRELSERSFYKKVENQSFGGETEELKTISSQSGITIQENKEKEGIEIKFPGKPTPEVLSKLKGNGFRWNHRTKVWYKRRSENAMIFAQSLQKVNA